MITLKQFQNSKVKDIKQLDKHSARRVRVHNLGDIPFSKFVDLQNYLEEGDFCNFCNIFVKRFQFVSYHNLHNIIAQYDAQKAKLFENYRYLFDPPQYGEPEKVTNGSELRKEFVEEFGSWVVLTDVVMRWANVGYKDIEKWKTSEFLFWANYLTGQKIIENVK